MNKFRNNLHSAFLIEWFDWSYREKTPEFNPSTSKEIAKLLSVVEAADAVDEVVDDSTQWLNDLQDNIDNTLKNPDFSKISDSITRDKKNIEKEEDFRNNKERFHRRLQSLNSQWQKYKDVWNQKIQQWFKQLISSLEDEHFFDWCENKTEKKKKIKEVEMIYRNQVKTDYTKNIWESSDADFDKIKDTIFDLDSETSPQRKTFYELINQDNSELEEITIRSNAVEKIGEDGVEVDSEKTKKRIRFLAHDLLNCIWEIKDPTTAQKLASNVDAPTEKDREEITNFIRVVDKLDGEDVEVKLINIFTELKKWSWKEDIKSKLEENNISFKDKKNDKQNERYLARIKKAFDFYKSVMNPNNPLHDQHSVYVDILTRIKTEWWFDRTIAAYEGKVAAYNDRKKAERKGKEFEKWKTLDPALKAFVDELNIKVNTDNKKVNKKQNKAKYDYTIVTRLSKKTDQYFKDTDIVDILSDLNNDWEILPSDSWTLKTWTQFKELYSFVEGIVEDKNIIFTNLLNQAKLYNSFLSEWVQIPEEEFTVDQIKAGNKKLIMLLQSVISMPWQDLYTLMLYGPDAIARQNEVYESLKNMPESADDPRVKAAATQLLEDKWITPDTPLDLENVTYDWLHQAVAWALFVSYINNADNTISKTSAGNEDSEFARGAGLWVRIWFDEWVKWLSLNVGVQWTEKWAGVWLILSYSPTFKVWDKTTITPWVHCWFITLGVIPVYDVGTSVAMSREWLSKNHIARRFGWQIGVDYIVTADTLVFSAMVWWDSDRAKWIDMSKETMEQAFNQEIMLPLLNNIAEKFGDEEFDLTKKENVSRVNEAIDATINQVLWDKKSEFKPDDIKKLKENTVRLLINYNNAPIANKNVREHIASEMAKCYANAWREQRLDDICDKVYLSGANAWVSFARVVGTSIFAPVIHLGLTFKKHRKEGYGDVSTNEYKLEAMSGSKRNQKMVDHINKYIKEGERLSLTEDEEYVVLPKKLVDWDSCDILFNPEMKELMKKDESWNILLSVETFISLPVKKYGSATKFAYILVGWWKAWEAINARNIDDSWFTKGEIDTWRLPGKETVFTQEILDRVLQNLKDSPKLKNDQAIQNFNFDDSILPQLKTWHAKYKIKLEKENNTIKTPVVEAVDRGDALQIEYKADERVELMDQKAQDIATAAYLEAWKVKTNALYNVSHDRGNKHYPEYKKFADQMRDKNYQAAKDTIIKLLPKMEDYINGFSEQKNNKVDFRTFVVPELQKIESDVELWQALLSINNVFARVSAVQWWIGENKEDQDTYHFIRWQNNEKVATPMGDIIKRRALEIQWKINKSNLDQDVKDSYTSLIGAMENHRKEHPADYNVTSRKRRTLDNAVWINLGNAINIENPLFNPEIYEDSQIKLEDLPDFEWKATLQQHAMEVMAKDKSLMWPILTHLNVPIPEWSNTIDYELVNYEEVLNEKNEKVWQLTINIGWKTVKFKADMSVWYFSQCVNHMILLDDIEAEVEWEWDSVHFWPWVMWWGKVIEWTKWSEVGTGSFTVQVSVWLWEFGGEWDHGTTPGLWDEGVHDTIPGLW